MGCGASQKMRQIEAEEKERLKRKQEEMESREEGEEEEVVDENGKKKKRRKKKKKEKDEHLILCMKGHRKGINCMSLSEDASYIITGSDDKSARVWNVFDGSVKAILRGHTGYITCCQLYEESAFTGSSDKTVRKWNIETGEGRTRDRRPRRRHQPPHLHGRLSLHERVRQDGDVLGPRRRRTPPHFPRPLEVGDAAHVHPGRRRAQGRRGRPRFEQGHLDHGQRRRNGAVVEHGLGRLCGDIPRSQSGCALPRGR